MLLNRESLAVAELASKDETRLNLAGVYVTPFGTVATDGHALGCVTLPDACEADFPPAGGIVDTDAALAPCIIPTDGAKALAKAIPTGRTTRNLPILAHARVDVASSNANGTFRAVTTDLSNTHPVELKKIAMDFPAFQSITAEPYADDVAVRIGFNAELLARVLKVAATVQGGTHAVALVVPKDPGKPLRIECRNVDTGQEGLFLVMPYRLPS